MQIDQAVAEDRRDTDDAAGEDRPVRGLEARQFGQAFWQEACAGQGEELARVAKDDAVKARHQAEQADPYQHVHPVGVAAYDGFHCLGQWVIDVRQRAPVAYAPGKDHGRDGQEHQGQDAGDIGPRDGAFGIFGLFGGHGRAFDGEEKPDRERYRSKDAGNRGAAEGVFSRPATQHEVAEAETRRHDAHEHQQFEYGKNGDDQFESGRDVDPDHVEGHEHHIGAHSSPARIEPGKLHIEVGADGHGNGRGCEHELDQGGQAGNHAAADAKSAQAIGERAAGIGDGRGQFGKAENKAGVHHRDHQGRDQKAQGARGAPAVTPAKILTGDH